MHITLPTTQSQAFPSPPESSHRRRPASAQPNPKLSAPELSKRDIARLTSEAQQTIRGLEAAGYPSSSFSKDSNSTTQERRCAILSGGSSSYMAKPLPAHNVKLAAVGGAALYQMEAEMRAAKEKAELLQSENDRLRMAIDNAPKISNETNASRKKELAELKARNKALENMIAMDEVMAASTSDKLRPSPKSFLESKWSNDLLASRILHREKERSHMDLCAERARCEAHIATAFREVAQAEQEVDDLVGNIMPDLGNLWERAEEFKERFGDLHPHEEEWTLEGWLQGVLQAELPKLISQVPFEDMLVDAPESVRDSTAGRRAFLHALGRNPANRTAMLAVLRRGFIRTLLRDITKVLWDATEHFSRQVEEVAEARELQADEEKKAREREEARSRARGRGFSQSAPPMRPPDKRRSSRTTEDLDESESASESSTDDSVDDEGGITRRDSNAPAFQRRERRMTLAGADTFKQLMKNMTVVAIRAGVPPPQLGGASLMTLTNLHTWFTSPEKAKTSQRINLIQQRYMPPEETVPVSLLSGPPPAESLRDPNLLFKTLLELVGTANGNDPIGTMEMEHLRRQDSRIDFSALCGGFTVHTTSEIEWLLVRDPSRALQVLNEDKWAVGDRTPLDLGFRVVMNTDSEFFAERLAEINERLTKVGDPTYFDTALFLACRLYSGPIAFKYFHILRRAHSSNPTEVADDICRGNLYPTTLHHVCKGMHKLSQLTRATPVYCAPAWSPLPSSFFDPRNRNYTNHDGSRGALQLGGNLEMNADIEIAKATATALGSALIYEVQQTSTQRGASLEWLTQTPCGMGPDSVLFSPIATFDVVGTRIESAHSIVELRPMTRSIAGGQPPRRGSILPQSSDLPNMFPPRRGSTSTI